MSYGELDAAANRLARQLLASGLVLGDTAAVLLPRSADLIVALLACAKAGIAFCPLDPTQPSGRLDYMVRASRADLLLTNYSDGEALTVDLPTLVLDAPDTRAAIGAREATPITDEERRAALVPETIAYVIFTSGSTGQPKGVAVSHGAIAQQVQAFATEMKARSGEALVGVTSIAFDPAMQDVFVTLSQGMVLVLLDEDGRRDPGRIHDEIVAHRAAFLLTTPGVWRALPLEKLPATLTAISGGEPFPAELLPRMGHFRAVINVYGPTEATVTTTWYKIQPDDINARVIPIGRPLAGYRVWIVDHELRPVPPGALGELCIGGGALAEGYVGEPTQTAAAFVLSPFGEGRMYRTGDLARWRPDGLIELAGRIDEQVKVLGHRIELGEIEHALRTLSWVADAAVQPYGKSPTTKLAAYIVPRPGHQVPPIDVVRAALGSRLPKWMLPTMCVTLAALPLTSTGKVDRKALPPMTTMPDTVIRGKTPQTPDELLLCRLFAQLTGHAAVTADSDFFNAGGDSLAAMILVTELRQLGRDLPLSLLASARTPAAIAAAWSTRAPPRGETTNRPTLFVIPGLGGEDSSLGALCGAWNDVLACVVLEYPDWSRLAEPGFCADDLIADFVRRILDHAHSGPLLLAGYSFGGIVASAIARHFLTVGQPVDALFIVDSHVGGRITDGILLKLHHLTMAIYARDRAAMIKGVSRAIGRRLVDTPPLLRLVARFRMLRCPSEVRYWLHDSVCRGLQFRTFSARLMMEGSLSPPLDTDKVVVFRAVESDDSGMVDLGWEKRCKDLRVEEVAGDHVSLLDKRESGSLYEKLPLVLNDLLKAQSMAALSRSSGAA